ncbi:MAG: YggS family pyridoxal phosphate-dependent enzyme [Myxococcaceae bacterium]
MHTKIHIPGIRLLAVSKGQPLEKIQALYEFGQRDFGENYAEEFKLKQEALNSVCPEIRWHFIGQIQSNKIKTIAQAHFVHSLSTLKHAKLLAEHTLHENLPVFIQVNLSREKNRGGALPEEIPSLAKAISEIPKLKLMGLMAILPLQGDRKTWFAQMQALQNPAYPELSMGMSDDYQEAIQYGATWIRLGSALFGPQTDPNNQKKQDPNS